MISLSVMLPCIMYKTLAIDLGLHDSWQNFYLQCFESIIETLQIKILPTTVKSKIYRQCHNLMIVNSVAIWKVRVQGYLIAMLANGKSLVQMVKRTSIAKLKPFHQNDSVQPKQKQQAEQGSNQYPEDSSKKADNCIVEEEYILKPVPETPV